jgi:ferric enterobactin receptor
VQRSFLVVSLFFLLVETRAQVILSGKVVEENSGEALPYSSIVLKSSGIGTSANLEGFFTLYNIPSDTAKILISYVGYEIL